jgi:AraC-like DNA-binding protein
VSFGYAAPGYTAEYARLFRDRARFGQAFTGLVFERPLLERPLGVPNLALFRDLTERAHERCEHMRDRSLRARVEAQLRAALPNLPSVRDSARAVGVSERSLRRHLASEGVSHSELVSRVQLTAARELLREPARPLKEVAAAVGFADAGAFQRAFKRWTGQSPAEFREG